MGRIKKKKNSFPLFQPSLQRSITQLESLTPPITEVLLEALFHIRKGVIVRLTPNTQLLWICDEHQGELMNKWGNHLCFKHTKTSKKTPRREKKVCLIDIWASNVIFLKQLQIPECGVSCQNWCFANSPHLVGQECALALTLTISLFSHSQKNLISFFFFFSRPLSLPCSSSHCANFWQKIIKFETWPWSNKIERDRKSCPSACLCRGEKKEGKAGGIGVSIYPHRFGFMCVGRPVSARCVNIDPQWARQSWELHKITKRIFVFVCFSPWHAAKIKKAMNQYGQGRKKNLISTCC